MPLSTEQKDKLNLFLGLKKNPALTLISIISEIKKEVLAFLQNELINLKAEIREELKIEDNKIRTEFEDIKNAPIKGVFEHLKEVKGIDGKTPTNEELLTLIKPLIPPPIIPKDGINGKDGKDGYIPIAGKDYPDKKQTFQMLKGLVSKIKLPEPYIPKRGIDYWTKRDMTDISQIILKSLKDPFKSITDSIKKLQADFDLLKERERILAGKTIHRGGISLAIDELVGTGDDSTTAFTLDYTPYDNNSIISLHVGGGAMFKDAGDYTRSGKTITFAYPPPTGAKIIASYRHS